MDESNPSCRIDSASHFCDYRATVDVLRLDLLHPVVSGNKWFKLKYYLTEAHRQQKTVLTFGGAFSNHIVATAAAAKSKGLKSIGLIRGEETFTPSHTLQQAADFGMKLFFVARDVYRNKTIPNAVYDFCNREALYVIPEGGHGINGVNGAKEILLTNETSHYTHIVSAVGTGTTLAGLMASANTTQKVIGVSVLKNNFSLQEEINTLLPNEKKNAFQLLHHYHFGGYAKRSTELLQFMNIFYHKTNIPTDFVYTAKAFLPCLIKSTPGIFPKTIKSYLFIQVGYREIFRFPRVH